MTAAAPAASAPSTPRAGGERGAGPSAARPLGKDYADGRAALGKDVERREASVRQSWRWRSLLWQVSSVERVRKCARVPHGAGGAILRLSEGSAGYAGLTRCGSSWSCLGGCRRRIGGRWAHRLSDLLVAVDDAGHGATLATFTVRHHAGQALGWLLDQLAGSWAQLLRNRAGRRVLARFGVQGQVRVIEITHGDACGWHPHYHVLFVHDTPLSAEMARRFGEMLFDVWVSYLRKRGLTAIEHRGGMDCRPVDLGDGDDVARYLNKVSYELTGEHTKTARRVENMTPEQLFAEFADTGDVAYLELWREYEQATHGRQRISPAKELFRRYGVAEVESDQEIVDEDAGGDEVIALPAETWSAIRGPLAGELQIVAEQGGRDAAAAWLTVRGLDWSWATPAPRLPRPPRPAQRAPRPSRPPGWTRRRTGRRA